MQTVKEAADRPAVKVQVMYYLPLPVREWLRDEAKRRDISASALIVELVERARERVAA